MTKKTINKNVFFFHNFLKDGMGLRMKNLNIKGVQ